MTAARVLELLTATALALTFGGCGGNDDELEDGEDNAGDDDDDDDDSEGDDDDSEGDDDDDDATEADVTWHEDIAPIIVGSCSGCHRDGGIAPFTFESYDEVAPLAEAIVAAVDSGSMPPWGAAVTDECQPQHGFKDDISLSDDEKDLLARWAELAAPEGDPALAADLPEPPVTDLSTVDQELHISDSVTIEGTTDEFLCYSLDPGLDEDQWLRAVQILPGNDKIVHHVLIYVDEGGVIEGDGTAEACTGGGASGTLVGAWAPGAVPLQMPEDTGMQVPAGARLVLNIHYHPTGTSSEVDDSTGIAIDWHDETPTWATELGLVGNENSEENGLLPGPNDRGEAEFYIPAGAKGHTEEIRYVVPDDIPLVRIWTVGTHMHYVGVDMEIRTEKANGSEECLLQTPFYDFEWQRGYAYDAPLEDAPSIQGGDVLYMKCTYDNSLDNPHVVEALQELGQDEPVDVYLGDETLDEMCLSVIGFAYPAIFE